MFNDSNHLPSYISFSPGGLEPLRGHMINHKMINMIGKQRKYSSVTNFILDLALIWAFYWK